MPAAKKRTRRRSGGALGIVRQAREAAKAALTKLRAEIDSTRAMLDKLVEEERIFRADLFGGISKALGRPAGKGTGASKGRRRRKRGPRRPPRAEKFFAKLGANFTLDDVRKLAGRGAGISLAQWSRAKRIKKIGDKYQKVA